MATCLSGGAKGADLAWAKAARQHGHGNIHWTFVGYRSADTIGNSVISKEHLLLADNYLTVANINIKRKWPTSNEFVNNLLRRNYYQVAYTDRVYAVANLTDDDSLLQVSGGTAWALEMYVDRWIHFDDDKECEMYLFDQTQEIWLRYDLSSSDWEKIKSPPVPYGVYTGIGSRDLTAAGLAAINKVYR